MKKKTTITFPAVFEILIWVFYVCMYKYSYFVDQAHLPLEHTDLPYKQFCVYAILTTLYLIPYYRWAIPALLRKKRYWVLPLVIILVLILSGFNNLIWAKVMSVFTSQPVVHHYFGMLGSYYRLDLNQQFTDLLAFSCVAFVRYSYKSEQQRHQMETDNLQLQLGMLKAQLQPHFLFNTLNDLYGLSLSGSKETSRFILLISQMMQYVLYDCDKEQVALADELKFLKGFFELEQAKFPDAKINFEIEGEVADLTVPPLLFLPLVENGFKHSKHKLDDAANVDARISIEPKQLIFTIQNDMLSQQVPKPAKGGIGLVNIKKRLELYYPNTHKLDLQNDDKVYIAKLTLQL